MTIPAWLERHLDTIGASNPDGVARTARATRCHTCGAAVLVGLDDNRCAWPARVDPAPLTVDTELAALLTGRATYRLNGTNRSIEIDRRDVFNIRLSPPGEECVVVASHECGSPLGVTPRITPRQITTAEETECPF